MCHNKLIKKKIEILVFIKTRKPLKALCYTLQKEKKEMSTTMMMMTTSRNENFSNLRNEFFNKSDDSDLVLHISDIGSPIKRLEIHAHRMVMKSASRYIHSCLNSRLNYQNRSLINEKVVLKLELDFTGNALSDDVVILFFSLFYLNRFDNEEELHYNILEIYELATFFLFDALTHYIENYLMATMSLSYFTPLCRFCLTFDEASNRYEMIESKAPLFTRLLQWYQCCVDIPTELPQLPYSSICDSNYYARHKESIITDLSRRVNNIDRCQLPRKEISKSTLRYYHRICPGCLEFTDNRIGSFYYSDLGQLKKTYRNGSETFFFRLKKKKSVSSNRHSPQRNNQPATITVELTRRATYTEQPYKKRARLNGEEGGEDWLEEEEEEEDTNRYLCKSRVTLLSQKQEKDIIDSVYSEKDISVPTEIGHFEPHKVKHCYVGQCDQCTNTSRQEIYIIILDVSLSREAYNAPIQEEMGMQVEESTAYI